MPSYADYADQRLAEVAEQARGAGPDDRPTNAEILAITYAIQKRLTPERANSLSQSLTENESVDPDGVRNGGKTTWKEKIIAIATRPNQSSPPAAQTSKRSWHYSPSDSAPTRSEPCSEPPIPTALALPTSPADASPSTAATPIWTLTPRMMKCGKPTCTQCPHGPYHYIRIRQDGQPRRAFSLGRNPTAAHIRQKLTNHLDAREISRVIACHNRWKEEQANVEEDSA